MKHFEKILLLLFRMWKKVAQPSSPWYLKLFNRDPMFKVGLSPSKKITLFASMKALFKNDEKCFLFHYKNSPRSQDI